MRTWQKIEFCVPITETLKSESGDFLIRGIAINATTTRNRTRFEAAELQASAPSLRNKPILKDHNNSVDAIVGRTTQNVQFDQQVQAVVFEARIVDEKIQKMINTGLIQNVSIGAHLTQDPEVVKDEEGNVEAIVAKGIDFVELSLVAVPADPNAGFAKALMESYDMFKAEKVTGTGSILQSISSTTATLIGGVISSTPSVTTQASIKCTVCGKTFMDKEALASHMSEAHDEDDNDGSDDSEKLTSMPIEEDTMAEEKQTIEALRAEREQLEMQVETLKIEKLKAAKAEFDKADSIATTAMVDKTQGTVEQASDKATGNYLVEQRGSKLDITCDVMGAGGKFALEKAPRYF